MKFTISALAIAAAAFVGTFVFGPAIADMGQHLSLEQFFTAQASAPVEVAKAERNCATPVSRIVDALSMKECLQ